MKPLLSGVGGKDRYQPLAHEAPKTLSVVSNNLKTVAFHNYAPVMACGSHDQGIRLVTSYQ